MHSQQQQQQQQQQRQRHQHQQQQQQRTLVCSCLLGVATRLNQLTNNIAAVAARGDVQRGCSACCTCVYVRAGGEQQADDSSATRALRAPQPLLVVEAAQHQAQRRVRTGKQRCISTGNVQQCERARALRADVVTGRDIVRGKK
jgi:hypothetical protein